MANLTLTVIIVIVSILGILLNGYILTVVLLTRQTQTANNILLLHLGTLDTLIGLLFLTCALPDLYHYDALFEGTPCVLNGFVFTLLHSMNLWTICGLNCDRYYAIAAPLHYGHLVNPKKILVGLGAGWIVCTILCVPPLLKVAPYKYIPGLGACAPDFASGPSALWYSAVYTALTLLLPTTLIICCNLKILMIARYHRHRIASAIFEVTLSAQVTITHQRNPFFVPTVTAPSAAGPPKFKGRSAFLAVLQILGSLTILYVPYYGLVLWEASSSTLLAAARSPSLEKLHPHFFSLASALLSCSPTVNGFIYGIRNKTLRKTIKNYWRKKLTKCEVNQEINARTPSTCGSRRPSITPLGFFTKPVIQRRLSEALLDVQRSSGSPKQSKMKRIVSELAWRHCSATGLNLSPCDDVKMSQTTSCNTLQVPDSQDMVYGVEEEVSEKRFQDNGPEGILQHKSRNFILQRLFGGDVQEKRVVDGRNFQQSNSTESPRITITRAFSEDSEKNQSQTNSPGKDGTINRKMSYSAATLLERRWRQVKYESEEMRSNHYTSSRSSDSSEASEASCGKIYMTIDEKRCKESGDIDVANEDQLLLSWPERKSYKKGEDVRKRPPLVKQSLVQHTQEVVL